MKQEEQASAPERPVRKKRKKRLRWILIPVGALLLLAGLVAVLYFVKVEKFRVTGNQSLSESQVTELLYPEEEDRRLYKVLYAQISGLRRNEAFDSASVHLQGLTEALITVKESAPAFVVATDATVFYFNHYGIRLPEPQHVEVAYPRLAGIRFSGCEFLKKPAMSPEDAAVFEQCLSIFREISEIGLPTDALMVQDGNFTLSFRKVRVSLGTYRYMREKLHEISYQFAQYEGLKGTLHMENFDPDDQRQSYHFTVDIE